MNKWISKMWCQYATEYYSALKKKEILTDAATWVKLEGVINEISQPQKDKYCGILLI